MKSISRLMSKLYLLLMYFILRVSYKALPFKLKIILLIKVFTIIAVVLILIKEVWNRKPGKRYHHSSKVNIFYKTPMVYSTYDSNPLNDSVNLRLRINKLNLLSRVRNWKRFKLVKDSSVIIVVQVHSDVIGLQNLITSLLNVRHIEQALLVFSHSYYSDIMNGMIRSITECVVFQVYYPYSVQLHKNKFPGIDKDDCVSDSKKKCSSRNAFQAERKHHWWWTANYVFDKFDITSYFRGPVIFLEEYHYVAPDLIHMLLFMRRSLYFYPNVELLTFGRPDSGALSNFDILNLEAWRLGLAFNRTFWRRITANAMYFCTFNDYDWSYSLYNVMQHFGRGYAEMVSCAAQRVFSTSNTGRSPGPDRIRAAQLRLNRSLKYLFPVKVKLVHLWRINGTVTPPMLSPDAMHGRGGWDDVRDQMFCYDIMAHISTTETNEETATSTDMPLHMNV